MVPLNGVADQVKVAAAQLLRNIKGGNRGHKHHGDARNDAGHRQREHHAEKRLNAVAAKVGRRLQIAVVELAHGSVDRQNHIGQKIVNHAKDHRAARTDHGHGGKAHGRQQAVDKSAVIQQRHERVGADQQADPHGQHEKDHEQFLHRGLGARHDKSQRITDQQANSRGHQRKQMDKKKMCE